MDKSDVLRELFDEKILRIITLFLDEPEKHFSLTQASAQTGVNVATAMRILDRLAQKDVIEISLMGKSKFYKLKACEKTLLLGRLLKKEEHLNEFIGKIKELPTIYKVVLESKTDDGAKLLIIGRPPLPYKKIKSLAEKVSKKYSFKIQYVELTEEQFNNIRKMGLYNLHNKIIWDRTNSKS